MNERDRDTKHTRRSDSDRYRHKSERERISHRSDRDYSSSHRSESNRSRPRSDYDRSENRLDRQRSSHRDDRRQNDERDYYRDNRYTSSNKYDRFGRDQRSSHNRSKSPPHSTPQGSGGDDHDSDAPSIERPNYTPTGLLARAQNTIISTHAKAGSSTVFKETHVLKYTEPADAAPFAPSSRNIKENAKYEGAISQYRLVCFAKNDNKPLENIRLDQQTSYLVGTDPVLSQIPLSNTKSADEQHAVIQYRLKISTDKYGDTHRQIKPYLIDLDSEDGTWLNSDLIPSSRYVELRHKDLLEFGKDGHEYVFIQETTS